MMTTRATHDLARHAWPTDRLGDAVAALARAAGLDPREATSGPPPEAVRAERPAALGAWLAWCGDALAIDVEAVDSALPRVDAMLRRCAPAVVCIGGPDGPRALAIVGARGDTLTLLGPDGQRHRLARVALRDALCHLLEAPYRDEIDALLGAAGLPVRHRARAAAAMLADRLATERVGGVWLLRARAGASLRTGLRVAGLPRMLAGMAGLTVVAQVLEIAAWALIGHAVLSGRFDAGWFVAWGLALASLVPLRSAIGWLQGRIAIEGGRVLKRRLMAGMLALDPDRTRSLGLGQWLGRVMDAQALESLALNGGLSTGVATLELLFAMWVLAQGAAPLGHVALALGGLAGLVALAWRFHGRLAGWTRSRMTITERLVEAMAGHRTRLAQERVSRRDRDEDRLTFDHLQASRRVDRAMLPMAALTGGGWLLASLALTAPALGGGASPASLAITVGGILLAMRAFGSIGAGLAALSAAWIAWRPLRPLLDASREAPVPGPFVVPASGSERAAPREATGDAGPPLVEASELAFAHASRATPVLRDASLSIRPGERILVEGASGAGKSTLAALLAGARRPDRGLLLLDGLDRHTLADGWAARVATAPQFHENHVLAGPLAFNLLMGREWPAREADLREARELCEALGLGPLLDRMPAGLMQNVGETGWQLSHGERSRVFLARALLQRAPLTILDESFAALDPETLRVCLATAAERARTLMVVAHP